ncbi:MAG: hypothetical protein AAF420_01390 [Pseudomonadota bacterium]
MFSTALQNSAAIESAIDFGAIPQRVQRVLGCNLDEFAERLGPAMKSGVIGDYNTPSRFAVAGKFGAAILECREKEFDAHLSVSIEFIRDNAQDRQNFLDRFDQVFTNKRDG